MFDVLCTLLINLYGKVICVSVLSRNTFGIVDVVYSESEVAGFPFSVLLRGLFAPG